MPTPVHTSHAFTLVHLATGRIKERRTLKINTNMTTGSQNTSHHGGLERDGTHPAYVSSVAEMQLLGSHGKRFQSTPLTQPISSGMLHELHIHSEAHGVEVRLDDFHGTLSNKQELYPNTDEGVRHD